MLKWSLEDPVRANGPTRITACSKWHNEGSLFEYTITLVSNRYLLSGSSELIPEKRIFPDILSAMMRAQLIEDNED